MALFTSQLLSAVSGSVGGVTFLHSRGGHTLRAKTKHTNPDTTFQSAHRAGFSSLVDRWITLLNQNQRDTWAAYADRLRRPNRLGATRDIGPMPMYLRSNLPRLSAGLNLADTAPILATLPAFTAIQPGPAFPFDQNIRIAFNQSDPWTREIGSALLIYSSRPVNPIIRSFRGSYRLAGLIPGNPIFPPRSPAVFPSPFTFAGGQRLFHKAVLTRFDGGLSDPYQVTILIFG